MILRIIFLLCIAGTQTFPTGDTAENDAKIARKTLDSSVATPVSVVLGSNNSAQIIDAVGKPVPKPLSGTHVASPINLLNPDRYEFFTFDDNGELVKRLMTLEEIQSIIANGDGEDINYNSGSYLPEKKVNDVVSNVQNVLKEQIESHKNISNIKPILDTPDVSSTWSMILPAIFNHNADGVNPDMPAMAVTVDTIMMEMVTEKSPESIMEAIEKVTSTTLRPISVTTEASTPSPTTISSSTSTTTTTTPATTTKMPLTSTISTTMFEKLSTEQYVGNVKPTTRAPSSVPKPIAEDEIKEVEVPVQEKRPSDTMTVTVISDNKFDMINIPIGGNSPIISVLPIEEKAPSTTMASTTTTPESTTTSTTTESVTTTTPAPIIAEEVKETVADVELITTVKPVKIQAYAPVSEPIQVPVLLPTLQQEDSSSAVPPSPTTEASTEAATIKEELKLTTSSSKEDSTTVKPDLSSEIVKPELTDDKLVIKPELTDDKLIKPELTDDKLVIKPELSKENLQPTTEIPKQEIIDDNIEATDELMKQADEIKDEDSELSAENSSEIIRTSASTSSGQSTTPILLIIQENPTTEKSVLQGSSSVSPIVSDSPLTESVTLTTENPIKQEDKFSTVKIIYLTEKTVANILSSTTQSSVTTPKSVTTAIPEEITTISKLIASADEPSTVKIIPLSEELITTISTVSSSTEDLPTTTVKKDVIVIKDEENTPIPNEAEFTTEYNKAVTESLNQLLLSSTNIYEINTQLAAVTDAAIDSEIITDVAELTDDQDQRFETETFTEAVTTENSLMSSIQELISQTVNDENIEEQVINLNANQKVQDVLTEMGEKPMENIQNEAATIGSMLIDESSGSDTDDGIQGVSSETDESLKLSEAVSSVLSQIYGEESATTIKDTTTELMKQQEETTEKSATDDLKEVNTEDTSSEENITAESSQTVITEIDTNKNELPVANEDVNPELNSTDSPIISLEIPQNKDEIKVEEGGTNINQEDDLVKIEVIHPVEESDKKADELMNQLGKGDAIVVKNDEKLDEITEASIVTSTIPIIVVNADENHENKSAELQPVKKIKVDDQSDNQDMKAKPPVLVEVNSVKPTVISSSVPPLIEDQQSKLPSPMITKDELIQNNEEGSKNTSWTLVSTIAPHINAAPTSTVVPIVPAVPTISPVKLSQQNLPGFGLEDTTSKLDTDIYQFVELCNELSFGFWNAVTNGISTARSVFVSPFAATSLLAMVFLGARGATSGEMNEILKLDDMVTFNPHLIFKNVSESIEATRNSGVAVSVIARELYSDRNRGKLLSFYKERAKQFYDGHVEEVNFREIGDVIRRRTNLIVKKNSNGKIGEYLKDNSITMRPPLAGISASIFQTDCTHSSTDGRDGELHFIVLPSIRQRRLVPVPAVVFRSGFLAGYDPTLDATAASIGTQDQIVSTILVIPGQQGIAAPGDGLSRLERQLSESAFKKGAWTRLLQTLIPRPGLELQIPRFTHKSVINATIALQRMGLKDLFNYGKADLRGLNGAAHELHLSDILQLNTFATCGEAPINPEQHHSEIYPATSRRPYRRAKKLGHYVSDSVFGEIIDEPRDYQRAFNDPLHDPSLLSLPLPLRPRQARIPDSPRLRFDRPFLFYVRHNPTGLILHMGRFNPRLLP
ncbi:serine protease inhibitor serpin [Holotrichia oblita]|uniref:Serine protease inhibitor serpin n=1 Tax=Holotrichia oblita TaxID=644536 RepID=A0ACB9T0M3_HOLOL|nr:serine protease inhibitor serpin [Holotrichia oblita]